MLCVCASLFGAVFSFCFFKKKTAYDMRIIDWSSDVCSSDLRRARLRQTLANWGLLDLQTQGLHALSGGELQRALLARLSLTDAQVLLFDEPEAAQTGRAYCR